MKNANNARIYIAWWFTLGEWNNEGRIKGEALFLLSLSLACYDAQMRRFTEISRGIQICLDRNLSHSLSSTDARARVAAAAGSFFWVV